MKKVLFFLVLFCLIACDTGSDFDQKLLHNEWAATQIITDGQLDPRDASGMRFAFDSDKNFAYKAFESAQQEGTYQLKGNKLSIKTTDNKNFFVLVKTLKADTLQLEMNDGKERLITLVPMTFDLPIPAIDTIVQDTSILNNQDSINID